MDSNRTKILSVVTFLIDLFVDLIPIVVAAVLFIRYETGTKIPTDDLLAAILGLLGAIAIGGLWDRFKRLRRIEELTLQNNEFSQKQLSRPLKMDEFFSATEPNSDFYDNANSIAISGVTLGHTAKELRHILGQRLRAGAYIRIIVIDPSSNAVEQIVLRSWGTTTTDYYKNLLNNTIQLLELFKELHDATGKVEIGLLPYFPSFGIQMVDPSTPDGAAFIEIYHHNSDSPSPSFRLTTENDLAWMRFFSEQFELMWKRCKIVPIITGNKDIS